ncbi:hypothetical protein CMV_007994 [Castanea mollissima]|uniref:Uncharacterized protein n=1 Tax=Castanea mollissima TaxID=60419 RepID=A0A8J4RH32_9ROSI|nr:hypothetical protein CMV_007994 [Castanea mollissima]
MDWFLDVRVILQSSIMERLLEKHNCFVTSTFRDASKITMFWGYLVIAEIIKVKVFFFISHLCGLYLLTCCSTLWYGWLKT